MIDKIPLKAPEFRQTAASLKQYDPKSVIPQVGALLTVPGLQANTVRLETLVHLAVAYCHGTECVPVTQIAKWLNNYLENSKIANLEDPSEDVFVGNVGTSQGNRRIFNGFWHSNDYFIQVVFEILQDPKTPRECRDLLFPVFALLALSDSVADRIGLQRWHNETSVPGGTVELPSASQLAQRARAVTFTNADLCGLGINRHDLQPFILRDECRRALASEAIGHSLLERRPLVEIGGDLVLVLPHAVSPAIVRYVLSDTRKSGYLKAFTKSLANLQARQVVIDWLGELKGEIELLQLPPPNGIVPSLNDYLFKYDIDKYLHVVVLHDRVELLEIQGLSSQLLYPEELRAGLEDYLHQVSCHCDSLSDSAEAMTLLIVGGLGRDIVLGFRELPNQRRLSVLRISDVVMLAAENDGSAARYLKCMWQKACVECEGVRFLSIDGDYDIYCYWRQQDYKLVPRDLPLKPGSTVLVQSDCARPVRRNARDLTDSHVVKTVAGSYVPVMRLDRMSYFKSSMDRPIYVSLAHLNASTLAGVVETDRGPSWFVVKPRNGPEHVLRFLYEVWHQFIDLYCRLVLEMETIYKQAPAGAKEIRLNLDDVVVPEDYPESRPAETSGKPTVLVNLEKRTAEVKYPPYLLRFFQQPENTGERMVLKIIAQGLIGLYRENTEDVEESVLDTMVGRVIGNSDIRVLHAFRIDPFQHMLARKNREPIFLAFEDYAFSKLGLSEGCTPAFSSTRITSKPECNRFLHLAVEKILDRLRRRLGKFDRASVIRKAIEVCEAASQDREHWNRTAQAMISLYASTDDVHAIARQRESDRSNVSISARIVIEMAICECPASGGRQLSRSALDALLAEVTLLIEVAMHSDAIYNDLTVPKLELCSNGEYVIDRSFHIDIIKPFVTAYHREKFESAAKKYFKLYQYSPNREHIRPDEVFSPDFTNAFQVEYGLKPEHVRAGFTLLMDLAFESDAVVVRTTLGEIRNRVTRDQRLSLDAFDAFIRTFGIFHRSKWDKPPRGFAMKDLYPWRFSRRLSASIRPILVYGEKNNDKVFFGVGALASGCMYLLERSEQGRLPQEFFETKKMKEYCGAVNDKRGHEFAVWVADQMQARKWEVRREVQMAELGAPAHLGDVDVLAWKPDGTIRLIECKRLTFARTVAEVANICRRFQGEAKDELYKHLQRVKWISAKPQCLRKIVGFVPDPSHIDHRLVTNTHVPMKYMESLPMETDKIGPLE